MNPSQNFGISYEELMNSHWIKHPTHPLWLHRLCNPLALGLLQLTVTILSAIYLDIDLTLANVVIALFVLAPLIKSYMAFSFMAGHGVLKKKKQKSFSFLGLPKLISIMLLFLGAVILLVVIASFGVDSGNLDKQSKNNFDFITIALTCSYVGILLLWRFHSYYETWYGDEYRARVQFGDKGYSAEEIEQKIKQLRKLGILPPYVKKS